MSTGAPLVLVADDDPDILELIRLGLGRAGYEVLLAGDGAEALAVARERRPAVAVLDVSMPGLDGFEVTAALKGAAETSRVRVVLLTARAQESDVAKGLAAGADEYVTKPFSPSTLTECVAALLAA